MTNQRLTPTDLEYGPGLLARAVRGAARGAARRPRLTVALWLVLIVACVAGGSLAGTRTLSNAGSGTGESARADARLTAAGLQPPAVESVLIGSSDRARTRAAVRALETRARALRSVRSVRGPADTPALMIAGGRTALVQVQLRGDPANAAGRVAPLQEAVGTVARQHPGVTFQQAGGGSVVHAINQIVAQDLQHAELISLPITLVILVLAFGALVAACVPLLLGVCVGRRGARRARAGFPDRAQRQLDRPGGGADRIGRGSRLLAVLHPPRARGAAGRAGDARPRCRRPRLRSDERS